MDAFCKLFISLISTGYHLHSKQHLHAKYQRRHCVVSVQVCGEESCSHCPLSSGCCTENLNLCKAKELSEHCRT